MSVLQELVGVRVSEAEFVEDYLQIWFESGACLNVYNKHQITAGGSEPKHHSDLVGDVLLKTQDDGTHNRLIFSNEIELSIDMREEAYLGPEAMQLTRPGAPPVVWRLND